jgi:2-polyprenyl-3-methyl-5-hydroxy-6-metoxy-1,4-benzoquinol methylase
MSKLGEAVLKSLVLLKSRAHKAKASSAPLDSAGYIRWQYESSDRLFAKYPNLDIREKEVLEIGCGTGGRTAFLASHGAKRVVGIDVNAHEIEIANQLCAALYPSIQGRAEYLVSAESAPLDIGRFDIVIMTDCMEHVVSPPRMLRLAYDYTRAGGRFYFSSVGWYHYMGSHLDLIPFVNFFFSDETIINTTRWQLSRPGYVPNQWDSHPPSARWDGIYNLRDRPGEHLNKLTIAEMKQLLRYDPFSARKISVLGFGSRHPLLRQLDQLRHIPGIQELYHSLVVVECVR